MCPYGPGGLYHEAVNHPPQRGDCRTIFGITGKALQVVPQRSTFSKDKRLNARLVFRENAFDLAPVKIKMVRLLKVVRGDRINPVHLFLFFQAL